MNFLDFYDMPLYRPPSEGDNVIVQATLGCSFNRCTFCSMYKGKSYAERPLAEVCADIDRLAAEFPEARRVFLADGDALALPAGHLLALIAHLHERFPRLARVSSYALPANLLRKSAGELEALRAAGLTLLYYGIETGSPDLLRRIVKGATSRGMAAGLEKAAAAGMKVSATVILGLGGRRHWERHIDATLELVNRVPLTYLSTLQLVYCFTPGGVFRAPQGGQGKAQSAGNGEPLARTATQHWPPWGAPFGRAAGRPSAALRSLERDLPFLRERALHLTDQRLAESVARSEAVH